MHESRAALRSERPKASAAGVAHTPFKSGADLRANASGLGRGAQQYSMYCEHPTTDDVRRAAGVVHTPFKSGADLRANGPKLGRLPQPYSRYGEDSRPTIRVVQPEGCVAIRCR